MTHRLKTVLCAVLAFAMIFTSMPAGIAFAVSEGTTVGLSFPIENKALSPENVYSFSPEESGYYSVISNYKIFYFRENGNSFFEMNGLRNYEYKYLKADSTYTVSMQNIEDDYRLTVRKAEAPTHLYGAEEFCIDEGTQRTIEIVDMDETGYLDAQTSKVYMKDSSIAVVDSVEAHGSIDENGDVTYSAEVTFTGVTHGETELCIETADGKKTEASVIVYSARVMDINADETTDSFPHNYTAVYTFTPSEDGTYAFRFKTDNTSSAVIKNENGEIIAKDKSTYNLEEDMYSLLFAVNCEKDKTYRIEVTLYFTSAWISSEVKKAVEPDYISVKAPSAPLFVGDTYSLNAKIVPWNAAVKGLTYTSSNEDVATVDTNGIVTAVGEGTAKITCTFDDNLSESCDITVSSMTVLTPGDINTAVFSYENQKLAYKFTAAEDGYYRISSTENYVSSESGQKISGWKICTIYEENRVFVVDQRGEELSADFYAEAGKAIFIYLSVGVNPAQYGTVHYGFTFNKLVPAQELKLLPDRTVITTNLQYSLWVGHKFEPELSVDEPIVSWTSDNEDVLLVDEYGKLTPISGGKAKIKAVSENGLTDEVEITIIEPTVVTENVTAEAFAIPENDGKKAYFVFTPVRTGRYEISNTELERIFFSLYDSNGYVDNTYTYCETGFRYSALLTAGTTYSIEVGSDSYNKDTIALDIKEVPRITKLEIVTPPDKTEYFENAMHHSIALDGLTLKVTWSSGDETYWSYDNDGMSINGEGVVIKAPERLTIGCKVYVECSGVSVELPITVGESLVARIEGIPLEVIENANGHTERDGDGNEYYCYDIWMLNPTVRIYYKNSEEPVTVPVTEDHDGYSFGVSDDQYSEHWEKGKTYYIHVSYLGAECDIPVTVAESTVKEIKIDSYPTAKFIYGDYEYGWYDADNKMYFFNPFIDGKHLQDISFTVSYNDSTPDKKFCLKDITQDGCLDGNRVELEHFDAIPVIDSEAQITVTLKYLGKSASFNLTMLPSPVESIELIYKSGTEYLGRDFLPDFLGSIINIRYKDGSEKSVIITKDNLEVEFDGAGQSVFVRAFGYKIVLTAVYVSNGVKVFANYLSARSTADTTVTLNKIIKKMTVNSYAAKEKNIAVTVEFDDKTTKVLHIENLLVSKLDFYGDNEYLCAGICELGFVQYLVTELENGYVRIKILDVSAETKPGCTHEFGAWTVKTPATTTAAGLAIRSCRNCGKVEEKILPKLPAAKIEIKNSASIKKSGNSAKIVAGFTPNELIKATGGNTKLYNADNTPVDLTKPGSNILKTGMKLKLFNGNTVVDEIEIVVLGDANCDGKITVDDARSALRNAVGLDTYTNAQLAAAQVTPTEKPQPKASVNDARSILRVSVNLDKPSDWLKTVK